MLVALSKKKYQQTALPVPIKVQMALPLTVTDMGGNTSTATATVTVEDKTAPVFTCPTAIMKDPDAGKCYATITVNEPTATDQCGIVSLIHGTRSDLKALTDPYPGGETIITWTAADGDNNIFSCQQSIFVSGSAVSEIQWPANVTVGTDPGKCTTSISSTVLDAPNVVTSCGNLSFFCERSDELYTDQPFPKGVTTVTWYAYDDNFDIQDSYDQKITVEDLENPAITCTSNINVTNDAGKCGAIVTFVAPVGTDNCPEATTVQTAGLATGSLFPVGTTTNTFVVTDAVGRTATCSFTVTVADIELPTITCATPDASYPANNGVCTYTVPGTALDPTFADNCTGESVKNNFNNTASLKDAIFPLGKTTVVWTATDVQWQYGHMQL